jgi:hypothetical protein
MGLLNIESRSAELTENIINFFKVNDSWVTNFKTEHAQSLQYEYAMCSLTKAVNGSS